MRVLSDSISLVNETFGFILLQVIRHLKRVLPSGPQRKREVDYVLDRISETMTPMHYHSREVIFSTFNLVSGVKAVVKVKYLVEGAVVLAWSLFLPSHLIFLFICLSCIFDFSCQVFLPWAFGSADLGNHPHVIEVK